MSRTIIRPDEAGVLRDGEGLAYNDAGQRIDEHGQLIEEVVQDAGVARHQDVGASGVDRHQPVAVDPNVVQGAAGAVVQCVMTLGDYNRPEQLYTNRCAIRPPPFQRTDFELKPAYYTLVGHNPFHGLSYEHPMDHIEKFEDLVTSIKANGVSYDYLFCKLFPYSLSGETAYWLKQLKPGSLTT
ncbi:hypothetical protein V5N11_032895 [Cardamine amara subsp. amara]|uniref:Uncharacterized protein n=1 Tax=Cardamine amara subsp. amara TaxID=228776 RepID=A0ABD1BLZ1_CARAN